MVSDVSILAAFIAGVLSISSPCVLPLIPIYLTHIAGVSVGERESAARGVVMRNAGAYVLGFSIVFIILGITTGAVGFFATSFDFIAQNKLWLVRIGGLLLVVLGLHQLGIFRIPFLYRDAHMQIDGGKPGTIGSSFVIGLTFGAGWSPCMGPILGAILTMAAGQGSIERATVLLTVYSAGLAIPFLLAAFAFGSLPNILRRVNKHLHMVTAVSGAVMIGVGVIMILGIYENLFTEIIRIAPWTPIEPEL
jgi:cytochrome c-type biogenesis protein